MKRPVWLFALLLVVGAGYGVWHFRDGPTLSPYLPEPVRAWLKDPQVPEAVRAWLPSDRAKEAAQQPPPAAAPPRAAPPVEIATAETGRVDDEVEALGTLAANESVVIAPEIAGRVTKLGFKEGERVKEGQPLVELDAAILQSELKQAEAERDLAKDTFERARSLVQRGSGTQVALEQATAQLAANEAKVALAQSRLERATITAPFEGVVGLRSVGVGDYVPAGQSLITLTDIDPIKVDFRVPETFLTRLKDGQPIQVRVDALPDRTFEGRVYAIDPVVDVNGRAVRLRAVVPNRDLALKPGLFARVTVVVDTRENAVLVPEAAVLPNGTGKAVFVVGADGKAKLTEVQTGKRLPGKVEVVAGLKAGDRVVTAGQMRLRDGMTVEDVPPQARLKP